MVKLVGSRAATSDDDLLNHPTDGSVTLRRVRQKVGRSKRVTTFFAWIDDQIKIKKLLSQRMSHINKTIRRATPAEPVRSRFPQLPRRIPIDYFDPATFNSWLVQVRAKYAANPTVALPLGFDPNVADHVKALKSLSAGARLVEAEKVLALYELPTDQEIARVRAFRKSNQAGEDDADDELEDIFEDDEDNNDDDDNSEGEGPGPGDAGDGGAVGSQSGTGNKGKGKGKEKEKTRPKGKQSTRDFSSFDFLYRLPESGTVPPKRRKKSSGNTAAPQPGPSTASTSTQGTLGAAGPSSSGRFGFGTSFFGFGPQEGSSNSVGTIQPPVDNDKNMDDAQRFVRTMDGQGQHGSATNEDPAAKRRKVGNQSSAENL